jgi:hypothetical protein
MAKTPLTAAVHESDAEQLLQLIGVNEKTATRWAEADAAAMFRHQMTAALDFDLSAAALAGTTTAAALSDLPQAAAAGIATFGELFLHPAPPLGLLHLSKDFFKRTAGAEPKDSAEHQVAYLGYLLSVAVARLRHGKRITNLRDSEFLQGLDWAQKQKWVEKPILKLLVDTRSLLAKK